MRRGGGGSTGDDLSVGNAYRPEAWPRIRGRRRGVGVIGRGKQAVYRTEGSQGACLRAVQGGGGGLVGKEWWQCMRCNRERGWRHAAAPIHAHRVGVGYAQPSSGFCDRMHDT